MWKENLFLGFVCLAEAKIMNQCPTERLEKMNLFGDNLAKITNEK